MRRHAAPPRPRAGHPDVEEGVLSTPTLLTLPPGAARRRVDADTPLALVDVPAAGGRTARGTAVLVPGYTGSKEDFLPLLGTLAAAGHRAVAYDQRGQHESPGGDDPAEYGVPALAADLLALIDALGDGPVHVVGHSFGGLVARAAALARPAALRSLTLLGSGPAAIDGPRAEHLRLLRPLLLAEGPEAVWAGMTGLAEASGAAPPPPEVAEFLRTRFFASSATGLLAMGDALLAEPDRLDALRATGLPLLVAHGERDDAWTPDTQAGMARRLGARHVVLRGAAHSPNVEAPEATVAALLDFWAATEGG